MGAKVALFEVVEDEFGGAVAVEVDFLDDNVFFFFDFVGREGGMEKDVSEEFETAFEMFGESRGVDAGFFFGGEGVEFATNTVDAVPDMVGTAVFGAFEDGVFDEVGDTFFGALLVSGTDVDIDSRVGDNGVFLAKYDADAVF